MREIFRKVSVQKTSRRLLSYFLMSCVKPMFQKLNHICLCVSIYNHKQKSYVFYKSCSKRFCNFYKRTTKCQSLFLIKNRLPQRRFPWDLQNIWEQRFSRTPLSNWFFNINLGVHIFKKRYREVEEPGVVERVIILSYIYLIFSVKKTS